MYPGWKVFMQGWAVGFFSLLCGIALVKGQYVIGATFGVSFLIPYFFGANNAERLRDD